MEVEGLGKLLRELGDLVGLTESYLLWQREPTICLQLLECADQTGESQDELLLCFSWQAPSRQIRIPERPDPEPLEEFQAKPIQKLSQL